MKCSNCGTDLLEGNNLCPSCGALNIAFDTNINNSMDTNETNVVNTNETSVVNTNEVNTVENNITNNNPNIEELTLDNENMTSNQVDITNGNNVSLYEEVSDTSESLDTPTINKEIEHIDIRIPDRTNVDDQVEDIENIDSLSGNISEVNISNKKSFKVPKINKKGLVNIGIYLSVLVVGILIGKIFLATNYCKNTQTTKKVNTKVSYIADGKNNVTNVSGYTYKIPESYKYDKSNNGLVVYSSDDTFKFLIKPTNTSYQDFSGAKTSLKATLLEDGLTVNDIKEIKYNETKYLIAELSSLNTNRMVLLREGDNAFYIEIVFNDNNYNYDVINIVDDIIKNASKEATTSTMESIILNDYSSLLEKTAKYNKEMK